MVNTTVNYTYGFVKRKLEVVADFLADESVKSRLLADQHWAERQRTGQGSAHGSGSAGFTWSRAAETARFIRRLGAGGDGTPYLDKLRQVVTQVGNSLGYVRMVRTAGMRCLAGSLPYVEAAFGSGGGDLKEDEEEPGVPGGFLRAAKGVESQPLVLEAAKVADEAGRSVRRCFEASTDHLNLLAQVCGKALSLMRSKSSSIGQLPMQLFHVLVPALCLSFLDSILVGREALAKRAVAPASGPRSNAFCFDDGFAVGVAFVLHVFGVDKEFQAMHWFETQITEGDVGMTRAAAGLTALQEGKPGETRRDVLERELACLAAAVEAASSLFSRASVASAVDKPSSRESGGADNTSDQVQT